MIRFPSVTCYKIRPFKVILFLSLQIVQFFYHSILTTSVNITFLAYATIYTAEVYVKHKAFLASELDRKWRII
jgi:hypothetical protein